MDTFNDCFPFGETDVSRAVNQADAKSCNGAVNQTVVRTMLGLEVLSDFSKKMRKNEIIETVYSTDFGFEITTVAA